MPPSPDNLDIERISLRLGRDQLERIRAKATARRSRLAPIVRELVQAALDAEDAATRYLLHTETLKQRLASETAS